MEVVAGAPRMLAALILILAPSLLASHAINTSLATVPCAYFGGNYRRR